MLKKMTESVTDDLILSQIGENLENKYYEECFTNWAFQADWIFLSTL